MQATNYLNQEGFKSIHADAVEIIKIITGIIKNTKRNLTPNH
ncbi:MAG: hypothetical protein ACK4NS_09305 [Saprospiraceae bacterium]